MLQVYLVRDGAELCRMVGPQERGWRPLHLDSSIACRLASSPQWSLRINSGCVRMLDNTGPLKTFFRLSGLSFSQKFTSTGVSTLRLKSSGMGSIQFFSCLPCMKKTSHISKGCNTPSQQQKNKTLRLEYTATTTANSQLACTFCSYKRK